MAKPLPVDTDAVIREWTTHLRESLELASAGDYAHREFLLQTFPGDAGRLAALWSADSCNRCTPKKRPHAMREAPMQ